MSPASPSRAVAVADPLVAEAAKKIAAVINDFKRELDERHGTWANAHGDLELALESQTYVLTVVPDDAGEEYPITVKAALKPEAPNEDAPLPTAHGDDANRSVRRESDAELERDIISRNKRKLDENDDASNKRSRTDDDEDIMPLITKEDLDHLLSKLREDIQEDTSECVKHVQRLLRRFKQEWHEQSTSGHDQLQTSQLHLPLRDSIPNGTNPGASFPTPSVDRDDQTASTTEVVKREAKLISTQIKWVEDCRRIAADIHDKREETWRTSSAGFHDRQRQDRENFQNRMLHESNMHMQTLNQIMNEVKAIGLYAQNMKWETPTSHLTYPPPSIPTPPAFPTHTTPTASTPGGRGRGTAPAPPSNQR